MSELYKSYVKWIRTRCSKAPLLLLSDHMICFTSSKSACVSSVRQHFLHRGQTRRRTAVCVRACVRLPVWVCVFAFVRVKGAAAAPMAAKRFGTGAARGRRRGASVAATLLLSALLTCCVRCAEPRAKPSNIILIVTDDQDVLLGGLVSGQSRKRPNWLI